MSEGAIRRIFKLEVWLIVAILAIPLVFASSVPVYILDYFPNADGNQYQTYQPYGGSLISIWALFWDALHRFVSAHRDDVDGISTAIIAIFTYVLARSTIRLWKVTERLTADGERQNAAVNRAFVFHKQYEIFEVKDFEGKIVRRDLVHSWENSGNTPAIRARSHVSWQSFAAPLESDFTYPDISDPDMTNKILGPHAQIHTDPLQIDQVIYQAVADGIVHLYTWGWVEYDDTLEGKRHRTEFCFRVWVIVHPDGQRAAVGFRYWGPHNGHDVT